MQCSEGAERDRYVNIYMDLISTKKKLVHDQDDYFFPEPTFYRVKKFVEYLKYKESTYENKKDTEKDSMELG